MSVWRNIFIFVINIIAMPSFWCFCCGLWTYFTPFSSVSIIEFQQVNGSWGIVTESTNSSSYFSPTFSNPYFVEILIILASLLYKCVYRFAFNSREACHYRNSWLSNLFWVCNFLIVSNVKTHLGHYFRCNDILLWIELTNLYYY